MIKNVYRNEEMRALEKFFKGYFAKNGDQTMMWFATGFALFLQGIFMVLPWQLWEVEEEPGLVMAVSCGMGLTAVYCYLESYFKRIGKEERNSSFKKVLRYMPVSVNQLRFFRWKKLICFQIKVYLVMQILQLFFSIVCLRQLAWGNVLFPFLLVFLLPVAAGTIMIAVRK